MTREEAIAVLQEEIDGNLEMSLREWRERDEQKLFPALRMAIEALSTPIGGDLISRTDAIEKLERVKITYPHADISLPIDLAIKAINVLPSADIIEFDFNKHQPRVRNKVYDEHDFIKVVRCKDCRQYIPHDLTDDYGWCCEFKASMEEDDFCSWGERREK